MFYYARAWSVIVFIKNQEEILSSTKTLSEIKEWIVVPEIIQNKMIT